MMHTQLKLDGILKRTVSHNNIHGAVFDVATFDNSMSLISAAGNIGVYDRYYIASINKLMISALVFRLCLSTISPQVFVIRMP